MASAAEQARVLLEGVDASLPEGELERRLATVVAGERPPLRIKFGVDPTSADLHLGHTVVLRKLRDFQRFGHTAVLLIGGFTAQVGDPSGRSTTRPRLTAEEVRVNAQTYLDQAMLVLQDEPLEIVDNSQWLASMDMADVLALTARMTVARMLEREDFGARYRANKPIAVSEFLYPLLQGHDSVAIRADVELGGTDQTFNLLVGRDLQSQAGQEPQCVLTLPLLEGIDGSEKMSKTAGNAIGLTEPPAEVFGKVMRVPDPLMEKYFRLLTDLGRDEVDTIARGLADGSLHPAKTKRRLAREIVTAYHDATAAAAAERRFDRQFVERGVPDEIAEHVVANERVVLASLLADAGLVASTSEARRMVNQGAVRLDGEVLTEATAELDRQALAGKALQVGKRRFVRLVHPDEQEPSSAVSK